jgi:DNA-binding IclR family transcriptional regulator
MGKPVLTELFRTEERICILRYVAGATGTSKPLVSRYLRLLVKGGFCTQHDRAYTWSENARSLAVKRLLHRPPCGRGSAPGMGPGDRYLRELCGGGEHGRQ